MRIGSIVAGLPIVMAPWRNAGASLVTIAVVMITGARLMMLLPV
jgi:hypothetical protein